MQKEAGTTATALSLVAGGESKDSMTNRERLLRKTAEFSFR